MSRSRSSFNGTTASCRKMAGSLTSRLFEVCQRAVRRTELVAVVVWNRVRLKSVRPSKKRCGTSVSCDPLPEDSVRRHRLVEALLRPEPGLRVPPDTHRASVGEDVPSLHGIGELDLEDLADLGLEVRIQHREGDLDAAVQVAGHPVRGGEQIFRVITVLEIKDPRVLE